MKIKILSVLLFLGAGLFAQIKQTSPLDSVKKIATHKKELIGTWVLDTINSTKIIEGHKPKPIKSLHLNYNVTQWDFLANRSITSAPYNKDKLFWSMNAGTDSLFLWTLVDENKAARIAKMQVKVLNGKKMELFFMEGSEEKITLFFNRREK
jgi:hypothetical protein